jgi:hypothetical protein
MFVLFIAQQLAPLKHGYVEKVGANLRPKCRTGMRGAARGRAGLILSGAKVGDIPCKTGGEDHNTTETFAARQSFKLISFRGPIPAPLMARRQEPPIFAP